MVYRGLGNDFNQVLLFLFLCDFFKKDLRIPFLFSRGILTWISMPKPYNCSITDMHNCSICPQFHKYRLTKP